MRRYVLHAALTVALTTTIAPVFAETPTHHGQQMHRSPYAGQEIRAIKSLSAADIAALKRGEGWGMAKAAELNGLPGPAHLLELKDRIPLKPRQIVRIEALHIEMKKRAITAGARLIALERELNDGFADGSMTQARLRGLLARIAAAREALRFVHLSTHLKTPALLTPAQIARYHALRGYAIPRR